MPMKRSDEITSFLKQAGLTGTHIIPLAEDASSRRYFRVKRDLDTTVLMDAPREQNPSQDDFVRIASWLTKSGLSAPEILHADLENGFVLCEDLSDAVFAREIDAGRLEKKAAFEAASDMLLHLHRQTPPSGLTTYTPRNMGEMISPLFEYYMRRGTRDFDAENQICHLLETALTDSWLGEPVTILRDFHADNLIWLPERDGHKRIGLLDFQDAAIGHVAYDLVSLLFDIRRDTDPELAEQIITRFAQKSDLPQDRFRAACAAQSVQRNLRILGIFSRLASERNKPGYLALQPRVWAQLLTDLDHPSMAALKDAVLTMVPAPDANKADQ